MNEEKNRATIRAAVDKWIGGDGAAFFRLLAEDAEWTLIGTTPVSRTYHGRRDFIENALMPLSRHLSGVVVPEVVNILADGDFVVLQWDGTAARANGDPYHNRYCWVMRMEEGKIVQATAYLDTELVSELLGPD